MKKNHNQLISVVALLLFVMIFSACETEHDISDLPSHTVSMAESVPEHSTQDSPDGIWLPTKTTKHHPFACIETYEYTPNGLLLQSVAVYPSSGREETTVFTYDDDRNLLSKITTDKNGTEIAYIKQTFADGYLMTKTELENGSSREKTTVYSYDEQGRLWKTESADETGVTETYTYHENGGYTVDWVGSSGNGSYLYDVSGNLLEIRDGDGELNEEHIYDEKGRLLTTVHYSAEEATFAYQYEYDDDGNLLKRDYYSYDELQQTMIYEYDEHGNQTKIKQIYNGNELTVSETEYELFGVNE